MRKLEKKFKKKIQKSKKKTNLLLECHQILTIQITLQEPRKLFRFQFEILEKKEKLKKKCFYGNKI